MKRLDIFFLTVVSLAVIFTLGTALCGFDIPWLQFWWILLLPMVFIKLVIPKSKLAKWFDIIVF